MGPEGRQGMEAETAMRLLRGSGSRRQSAGTAASRPSGGGAWIAGCGWLGGLETLLSFGNPSAMRTSLRTSADLTCVATVHCSMVLSVVAEAVSTAAAGLAAGADGAQPGRLPHSL